MYYLKFFIYICIVKQPLHNRTAKVLQMLKSKNTKNMVRHAKYGDNLAIARRLGVDARAVRNVRCRMRKGETNFYSATNRRICRAILRAERAGAEGSADIP